MPCITQKFIALQPCKDCTISFHHYTSIRQYFLSTCKHYTEIYCPVAMQVLCNIFLSVHVYCIISYCHATIMQHYFRHASILQYLDCNKARTSYLIMVDPPGACNHSCLPGSTVANCHGTGLIQSARRNRLF